MRRAAEGEACLSAAALWWPPVERVASMRRLFLCDDTHRAIWLACRVCVLVVRLNTDNTLARAAGLTVEDSNLKFHYLTKRVKPVDTSPIGGWLRQL